MQQANTHTICRIEPTDTDMFFGTYINLEDSGFDFLDEEVTLQVDKMNLNMKGYESEEYAKLMIEKLMLTMLYMK